MKSLMRLLECVLADAGTWCSTSTTRDFETVTRRVKHEGISFITITLPVFCQDFESCLDIGRVDSSFFLSFKRNGALPAFLQGLLSQVFDASDGTLLEEVNHLAVHAVRQICLLNKKVLLPCSKGRERKAFDSYLETDRSVLAFENSLSKFWTSSPEDDRRATNAHASTDFSHSRETSYRGSSGSGSSDVSPSSILGDKTPIEFSHFSEVSNLLWGSLFTADSFRIDSGRVLPKHGPGSTAERLPSNRRFSLPVWHRRLDHWFPASDFVIPNSGYIDRLDGVQFVDPEQELPVRVITVPKTLKGPRIIAIEPACVQYTQQAILEILVDRLESYRFTSGSVNFSDQTENQRMALSSSKTGRFATIDLKDASDRVSSRLVWQMLERQPIFRSMVFACRSTRARVPGYGIHTLSRFASMGSALCFPIEAMVFYTIVLSAILRAEGSRLTPNSLVKAKRSVRVYGDDIIVPVEYVQAVKRELEWFNLRVNDRKSFWNGKFRESCGLDAYDGTPVTPVYVRRELPASYRDSEELVSAVSLGNQLYEAGYWRSATYVRSVIDRLAIVPYVSKNSSILGWTSYYTKYEIQGWDENLHRYLVKGNVVSSKLRHDYLDDYGALMKFFLKRGSDPYFDVKHLERYGRPLAVYTTLRWAPPY